MFHFTNEGAFLVTAKTNFQYGVKLFSLGIFNTEKRASDFIFEFEQEQEKLKKIEHKKHGFFVSKFYNDFKIEILSINPPVDPKKIKYKTCGTTLLTFSE